MGCLIERLGNLFFLYIQVLLLSIVVLRFFSYLWYDYILTNMNCKTITERLKRVAAIVDGWKNEDGVPQIERDIALGELREIYNALLVVDAEADDRDETVAESEEEIEVEVEVVVETPTEDEVSPTSDVASMESFYDALDIDALLGLTDETNVIEEETTTTVEPVEEQVAKPLEERSTIVEEQIPEPEPVVEPEQKPVVEQKQEEQKQEEQKLVGAGLFDLNDIPVRSKSRRKMISLYSDDPIPVQSPAEPVKVEPKAVESAPKVESKPVEEVVSKVEVPSVAEPIRVEPPQRLGDSFGEVKTLADQMAKDDAPTTPFNRITELRQAIGLNDKFLMIRDLFGGDAARYEATIDTLDEFEDLDECIIYIVENFRWNPDLEAAKLLVSLIERKLA